VLSHKWLLKKNDKCASNFHRWSLSTTWHEEIKFALQWNLKCDVTSFRRYEKFCWNAKNEIFFEIRNSWIRKLIEYPYYSILRRVKWYRQTLDSNVTRWNFNEINLIDSWIPKRKLHNVRWFVIKLSKNQCKIHHYYFLIVTLWNTL
jgi:hypothetical protein